MFKKEPVSTPPKSKKASVSRVIVEYDCGFPNNLFIRGKGGGLNWDKGQPLKNVKYNVWVWETEEPFDSCEFKISLNDLMFEAGENHKLEHGKEFIFSPNFS